MKNNFRDTKKIDDFGKFIVFLWNDFGKIWNKSVIYDQNEKSLWIQVVMLVKHISTYIEIIWDRELKIFLVVFELIYFFDSIGKGNAFGMERTVRIF